MGATASAPAAPAPGSAKRKGPARPPPVTRQSAEFALWTMVNVRQAHKRFTALAPPAVELTRRGGQTVALMTRRAYLDTFTDYGTLDDTGHPLSLSLQLFTVFSEDVRKARKASTKHLTMREQLAVNRAEAARKAKSEAQARLTGPGTSRGGRHGDVSDTTSRSPSPPTPLARPRTAPGGANLKLKVTTAAGAGRHGLGRALADTTVGPGALSFEDCADTRSGAMATEEVVASLLTSTTDPAHQRIDALEVFLCLALFCQGDTSEQLAFCFEIFDADKSDSMDSEEATSFLTALSLAAYRMHLVHELATPEAVRHLALTMFRAEESAMSALTADSTRNASGGVELSSSEFVRWSRRNVLGKNLVKEMDKIKKVEALKVHKAAAKAGHKVLTTRQRRKLGDKAAKALQRETHYTPDELRDLYVKYQRFADMSPTHRSSLRARGGDDAGASDRGLDIDEFAQLLQSQWDHLGDDAESLKSIQALFTAFDVDDSGDVDFVEMVQGLNKVSNGTAEDKLAFIFSVFDKDGSGDASVTEILEFLQRTSGQVMEDLQFAQELVETMDASGDNVVSLDEFKSRLTADPLLLDAFTSSLKLPIMDDRDVSSSAKSMRQRNPKWDIRHVRSMWQRYSQDLRAIEAEKGTASPHAKVLRREQERKRGTYNTFTSRAASIHNFRRMMYEEFDVPQSMTTFVDNLFNSIDPAGTGLVQWEKLFGALSQMVSGSATERAIAYFQIYDADADGELKVDEIQKLLTTAQTTTSDAADKAARLLAGLDVNGDGSVSLAEFTDVTAKDPRMLEAFGRIFGVDDDGDESGSESDDPDELLAGEYEGLLSSGIRGRGVVGVGTAAKVALWLKAHKSPPPSAGLAGQRAAAAAGDGAAAAERRRSVLAGTVTAAVQGKVLQDRAGNKTRRRRRRHLSRLAQVQREKRAEMQRHSAEAMRSKGLEALRRLSIAKLETVLDKLIMVENNVALEADEHSEESLLKRLQARKTKDRVKGSWFPAYGETAATIAVHELATRTRHLTRDSLREAKRDAYHATLEVEAVTPWVPVHADASTQAMQPNLKSVRGRLAGNVSVTTKDGMPPPGLVTSSSLASLPGAHSRKYARLQSREGKRLVRRRQAGSTSSLLTRSSTRSPAGSAGSGSMTRMLQSSSMSSSMSSLGGMRSSAGSLRSSPLKGSVPVTARAVTPQTRSLNSRPNRRTNLKAAASTTRNHSSGTQRRPRTTGDLGRPRAREDGQLTALFDQSASVGGTVSGLHGSPISVNTRAARGDGGRVRTPRRRGDPDSDTRADSAAGGGDVAMGRRGSQLGSPPPSTMTEVASNNGNALQSMTGAERGTRGRSTGTRKGSLGRHRPPALAGAFASVPSFIREGDASASVSAGVVTPKIPHPDDSEGVDWTISDTPTMAEPYSPGVQWGDGDGHSPLATFDVPTPAASHGGRGGGRSQGGASAFSGFGTASSYGPGTSAVTGNAGGRAVTAATATPGGSRPSSRGSTGSSHRDGVPVRGVLKNAGR